VRLTSKPEPVGFLHLKTKPKEQVRASLTWRFESYFPIETVKVKLDAAASPDADCVNSLLIGTDELGRDWLRRAEQRNASEIGPLVVIAQDLLRGKRIFYVRLEMQNRADHPGQAGNQIDRLRVECVHQSPAAGATARLVGDDYGNLSYADDFSTTRWRHLGSVKVAHPKHGGHRGGEFWVGMVGGYATSTQFTQRLSSPKRLQQLIVTADCYADGKNLGGQAVVQVAPQGGEPIAEVASKGLHNGPLRLEIPGIEIGDQREFDIRVVLRSTSGVEHGSKACASLRSLRIEGK